MKNVSLEHAEWGEVLYSIDMLISTRKRVSLRTDFLESIAEKIQKQIYPNLERLSAGGSK